MKPRSALWLSIGGLAALLLLGGVYHYKYPSGRKPFEPAPGSVWVEPTTRMHFVWVPSGCFNMGFDQNYHQWDNDNQTPVHRVCVKGFYLGKYEVTQAQYEQITGTNPCAKECSRFLGPDRAVTNVRWEEAKKAAEVLGLRSGNEFRLPSEAEWEYACLAGGLHKRLCGEGRIAELAWIAQSRYGPNADRPQTVGGAVSNLKCNTAD